VLKIQFSYRTLFRGTHEIGHMLQASLCRTIQVTIDHTSGTSAGSNDSTKNYSEITIHEFEYICLVGLL
jgi:hypothetical protein